MTTPRRLELCYNRINRARTNRNTMRNTMSRQHAKRLAPMTASTKAGKRLQYAGLIR